MRKPSPACHELGVGEPAVFVGVVLLEHLQSWDVIFFVVIVFLSLLSSSLSTLSFCFCIRVISVVSYYHMFHDAKNTLSIKRNTLSIPGQLKKYLVNHLDKKRKLLFPHSLCLLPHLSQIYQYPNISISNISISSPTWDGKMKYWQIFRSPCTDPCQWVSQSVGQWVIVSGFWDNYRIYRAFELVFLCTSSPSPLPLWHGWLPSTPDQRSNLE